jgi:predicted O-methyltransferase YrrM
MEIGKEQPPSCPILKCNFASCYFMHKNQLGLSDALYRYTIDHSQPEAPILAQLRQETATHPQARMQISPEQGSLLQLLIQLTGAKRCLEIGVFTGYSSLAVALALPADGYLLACDVSDTYTNIARRYWSAANVQDKIELRLGKAIDTLDQLLTQASEPFDFAFIDADKGNYGNYFDRIIQLLRPGGLIAVDNTLWSGRVADPQDQDKITRTLRNFNEKIVADPRVNVLILPIGDGLTLAYKC